ncbi:response regulator [Rhizobium straminoryzae]|uniref:Sensory/regulatory protein RpfC n=1 Tax=Rhizobium straminoryzae TaxID=1387186 RepID=A0A549TD97_9HYPH|nr:response regulator [Rhizobium straminoryzae]
MRDRDRPGDLLSSDRELLQRACDRINDLDVPAFIKDGSLRYVAVNDAYARRCGVGREAFAGRTAADMALSLEDDASLDKQRRSLVFGSDETSPCRDETGVLRHDMRVERFVTDDDRAYLFAVFEPVAWQPEAIPTEAGSDSPREEDAAGGLARGQVSLQMLGTALDLLDAGIGIFSESDALLYYNAQLDQYFQSLGAPLRVQMPLRELVEQVYRFQLQDMPETDEILRQREEWIAERMETLHARHWQAMEPLADGRWMRSVNRRLDNGWLIVLRLDVTEYKVQEMRLARKIEESEIFRAAFEDLPVAVFLRDSQRRLIYANGAYEAMVGESRSKIMGQTEDMMFPAAAERFREENERLLAEGGATEKAEDVPLADGRSMAAITRLARISSPAGEPYIVGSITDVTMVRRAQQEAERLHREVQAILDSLTVGVVILDDARRFEYANRTFRQLFCGEHADADPEAGDKRDYSAFVRAIFEMGSADPDEAQGVLAQHMQALDAEGEMAPVEVQTNDQRTILMARQHLADAKMLLSFVDITTVKKREKEVQEAREALERHGAIMHDATSVMSQGLLILREGRIVFCNEALSRILQVPPGLVQAGKPWRAVFAYCAARGDFGSPEQAEETFHYWQRMETEGKGFSASLCIEDTSFIDAEMNLSANGNWLAVFDDVTDVRMRERELQRLLGRAEAADRAKSEFLANMSHEIRTPMNGVLGMAELLAKSNLDTRQKTFTDIIVKSGNALLTIINDILDFSKIDAGQMTLRRAVFDPVEAVEDVATLLSSSASEKDIELLVRGASTHHTVIGDPGRFRQIVTNLVGNAVKFTERGHVLIDVTSEPAGDEGVTLTIRIEDTGLGIPDDKLKTIFEKFSQVDTSSTRRYEGTGLGLAITAGLVDLFGGRIAVESRLGQGSVFTVTLPFAMASARAVREAPVANIRGARVVVIDDNSVNRRILTEQLAMWDFDCVAVESGEEGLRLLRAAAAMGVEVDALILDYQMPEMSGLEVAAAMRNDPALTQIAIIFLTSMDTASSEQAFEQLQIEAHLMKPARSNLLRSTIGDVIRASRQKRRRGERAPARMVEGPVARPPVDVPAVADLPSSPLDVLVAEDNEVNQIVFTQILQATGLRFHIVPNGEEAVAAWRNQRPSLILMDVSMPVMNGHQATRRIREIEAQEGRHVPIVGVTAHALDSDRDLCLAAGMDDYLSKPISPEILEAKIRQWRVANARTGEASRP